MTELVITLILAKGALMPIEIFNISCHEWYNQNVEVKERIIKWPNQNLYVHKYKGKHIFGYICSDHKPT